MIAAFSLYHAMVVCIDHRRHSLRKAATDLIAVHGDGSVVKSAADLLPDKTLAETKGSGMMFARRISLCLCTFDRRCFSVTTTILIIDKGQLSGEARIAAIESIGTNIGEGINRMRRYLLPLV